jgi:hypothetical protein
MPSPTTAYDLIVRSMKLAKILEAGETPTAEEATDALATLNDVLENWDTEPLSLWSTSNFVGATVAGQATYTIGSGGNFNTTRPSAINGAYVTFSGVDFPVNVIGQLEYNGYSLKTFQQPIAEKLLYVNDFPLGLVTLWPVPSQAIPITLTFDRLLTQLSTLSTAINYPPGAAKALRYALAVELATEYGAPIDSSLAAIAADSKADYKRANKEPVKASFDGALIGIHGTGNYRVGY